MATALMALSFTVRLSSAEKGEVERGDTCLWPATEGADYVLGSSSGFSTLRRESPVLCTVIFRLFRYVAIKNQRNIYSP